MNPPLRSNNEPATVLESRTANPALQLQTSASVPTAEVQQRPALAHATSAPNCQTCGSQVNQAATS